MSPAEELLIVEREKLDIKRRKLDLMEKMVAAIERNTQAVSDIRDFLHMNKQSMFMPIDIAATEQ